VCEEVYERSSKKFEVLGRNEVAMRLPLPLVEVWEELQPEVEHLTGLAGLKIIRAVIEDEVTRRVGPRYQPAGEEGCLRWGQQAGYVVFAGQKAFGGPITVISRTVTSATAASIMAADSTGLRAFTAVPTFTRSQECTLARSAALITARMSEAFLPAVVRAFNALAGSSHRSTGLLRP
jgi:hypothetical protein